MAIKIDSGRYRTSKKTRPRLKPTCDTGVALNSPLLIEAARLIEQGKQRRATKILLNAIHLVDDALQPKALEMLAVSAAECGRHRISSDAVFSLKDLSPRPQSVSLAYAHVALARGNFMYADGHIREALDQDPTNHEAWTSLAASYVGLGWFEQAQLCLDRVNRNDITDLQSWRIGRACNHWLFSNLKLVPISIVAIILAKTYVIPLLFMAPLAIRGFRMQAMKSDDTTAEFIAWAKHEWRTQKARQVLIGLAVFGSLMANVVAHLY